MGSPDLVPSLFPPSRDPHPDLLGPSYWAPGRNQVIIPTFRPVSCPFPLPGFICLISRTLHRERVKAMFYHAYDSYLENAFPYDELRPLTCDGHDTWGR